MQREVEEYLIKTGKQAQLSEHLRQRLEDSGWYDSVRALAARELAQAETPTSSALNDLLEPKAISMVPEEVKIEMIKMIKSVVDPLVEEA